MKSIASHWLRIPLIALAVIATGAALADSAQAKAHEDKTYIGYTGHVWEHDYGVTRGVCYRTLVGNGLRRMERMAKQSPTGTLDLAHRSLAVAVGSVLGNIIGREIGRKFDDRDRACFGHSLELVPEGQSVTWTNEKSGVTYVLEPHGQAESGGTCRTYKLTASKEDKSQADDGRACRNEDGTWKKV
jgi:surface antigen